MVRYRTNFQPMGNPDPAADRVRSWLSVVRAYHLCDAVMVSRLNALGVKLAEHEVLANLLARPGITQQTLAARCFSAKSHISALLAQMEARGWVRREPDPADARAKQLFLTRSGEAVARRTAKVQAAVVDAMASAVSEEDMARTERIMNSVSQALERLLDERPR
jgi:DNA-binding MarR family transcriptional regulator